SPFGSRCHRSIASFAAHRERVLNVSVHRTVSNTVRKGDAHMIISQSSPLSHPSSIKSTVLTGCLTLGLVAGVPHSSTAGLTIQQKNPRTGIHGTYTNATATIQFQTIRTRRRVSATVSGADGTVLMTVEGNRKVLPQVTFAGITVTDHGDFTPEEESAIR